MVDVTVVVGKPAVLALVDVVAAVPDMDVVALEGYCEAESDGLDNVSTTRVVVTDVDKLVSVVELLRGAQVLLLVEGSKTQVESPGQQVEPRAHPK